MLSQEQVQKIKTHLLDQLINFPEDQRKLMRHKIMSMTNKDVEEFISQNNLNHLEDKSNSEIRNQPACIFCSIIKGDIPSYKIYEDNNSIAILEINTLSKGHTLLVPKEHIDVKDISSEFTRKAEEIGRKIKETYKPLELKIEKNNILGHSLIEIIPIYGNEKERERADENELKKIKEDLQIKEFKKEEIKKETLKKEEIIKLKPRLP